MCFLIAWSALLSCSLELLLVLTSQHLRLYTAELQWNLLLHACLLLLQNTFSPIFILESSWPNSFFLPAEIPCLQSQSHFSQPASCFKTFHTFILDFSGRVSAVYSRENLYIPSSLSFPSPPRLLCSLCKDSVSSSPLIQVEVPESCSFSNHLQLPQCHPVLFSVCICVFPPFLPFSYEAPALPFTVQSCFSLS